MTHFKHHNRRRSPRYHPPRCFVSDDGGKQHPLEDLNLSSIRYLSPGHRHRTGDRIRIFLTLQSNEEQYEIPARMEVTRVDDTAIAGELTFDDTHYNNLLAGFLGHMEAHRDSGAA